MIKSEPQAVKRKKHQVGGSIGKISAQVIIPIESKPETVITKTGYPIQINLVSPADATVQQAESELSHEAKQCQGIKRRFSGDNREVSHEKKKKKKKK